MNSDGVINFILSLTKLTLHDVVRLALILVLALFTMVALIMVRQVQLMNSALSTSLGPVLFAISIVLVGLVASTLLAVIGIF